MIYFYKGGRVVLADSEKSLYILTAVLHQPRTITVGGLKGVAVSPQGVIYATGGSLFTMEMGAAAPRSLKHGSDTGFDGDVAVSPSGKLFVVDSKKYRIQVLSSSGQFLRKFGTKKLFLSEPLYIAVSSRNTVAVNDALRNIYLFTEGQAA